MNSPFESVEEIHRPVQGPAIAESQHDVVVVSLGVRIVMKNYIYWTFTCQNEKCRQKHDYAYLGSDETVNLADLPIQQRFTFICPKCSTPEVYSQWDLEVSLKPYVPDPDNVFIGPA